ncbi:MAG: hypothetical protein KGZ39_08255 [Simkania sp.]|nr:hypothetical protein [Simkania sp.]
MALLSVLFLSAGSLLFSQPIISAPLVEVTTYSPTTDVNLNETTDSFFHSLIDTTFYFGSGTILGSAACLTGVGWVVCHLSPWTATMGNECLLSSQLLGTGALHSFTQMFKISPLFSFFFKKIPPPYSSWDLNKKMLLQIPAFSPKDMELLHFLQERWLAKSTGCYPFFAKWMCPSFGISLQAHPETTNSYARDPSNKLSQTYKNRVEAWKYFLPHPQYFPLVLTRPSDIRGYLPFYLEILHNGEIPCSVEKLALIKPTIDSPLIIDATSLLPKTTLNQAQWLNIWHSYESRLSTWCKEHQLDLNQILCIHRVQQENIGGIRLLPFSFSSKESIEKHHQFLLEWISKLGLSANRIELDRFLPASNSSFDALGSITPPTLECASKEQWISFLDSVDRVWKSNHAQKTLMVKGTLQLLKDLCAALSQKNWEEVMHSPTRSSAAQLSFAKIQQQFHALVQNDELFSFNDTATHIEQIHANLSSLLEIFAPFTAEDFPIIFRQHLTSIPKDLQPLTRYGIHTSAMTSLAGIFKALKSTLGKPPCTLYGENTYFECIYVVERITNGLSVQEATEQEWKEVDLILAQFNPALKRITFKATEYHAEKIEETLHQALSAREGKPLTLALDCTLDFSDSNRVGRLLYEFKEEIKSGKLSIIGYRSGSKFDLFGMDNYCGAPFFMIHSQDTQWSSLDSLLTDPVLQTDRLSLNWFCLAYQHASPYLELYRKQVFDNTRAVLNKVPARLLSNDDLNYRIIPIDSSADPSFIDIKIFGPLHEIRGGVLLAVLLTMKCLEAGHPLLYRPSLGFYHPNLSVLFSKEFTTIRLTLGLDPTQVDVIVNCFEMVDALNGPKSLFKI